MESTDGHDVANEAGQTVELRQVSSGNAHGGQAVAEQPVDEYPTGLRFVLLTLGLILSIFLAALDSSIISTAIPRITDQFGTVKDVGWYGSAYSITNAAFQSTWGKAYKHFPLKWTFLLTIAVFELGNVISATAPTSPILILGRIVAGVGGGGIMTGAFIIIALSAKPQYRAAYMGVLLDPEAPHSLKAVVVKAILETLPIVCSLLNQYEYHTSRLLHVLGVTFGCASVVGPLLGGVLTDGPGWRWCFWISLPLGVLGGTIMTISFKPPRSAEPVTTLKEKLLSLDLVGGLLAMGSMTFFVLAMQGAGVTSSWRNWRVVASLAASGALLVVFVVNEWWMGPRAMIQTHLLKRRSVVVNSAYSFFLAGLFFPLSYALSIQFQSLGDASASESGVRLIPLILGVSVFTMVANGIITFWRRFNSLLVVGAIAGTVGVVMVHRLETTHFGSAWIGFEVLTAAGVGLALQVPMISNQAAVASQDMAAVTSLSLFCENVGTALFVASTEAAFTNGLVSALTQNLPALDPKAVIDVGATEIRRAFRPDQVQAILASYLRGCKVSHFVPIACGSSAVLVSMIVAVPAAAKEFEWKVWSPRGAGHVHTR